MKASDASPFMMDTHSEWMPISFFSKAKCFASQMLCKQDVSNQAEWKYVQKHTSLFRFFLFIGSNSKCDNLQTTCHLPSSSLLSLQLHILPCSYNANV
jgi:hypothetical protein